MIYEKTILRIVLVKIFILGGIAVDGLLSESCSGKYAEMSMNKKTGEDNTMNINNQNNEFLPEFRDRNNLYHEPNIIRENNLEPYKANNTTLGIT